MKRDWTKGTVAGVIGGLLTPLGLAGLYHRAYGRGGVLTVAGLFMLLSAYHHAGFTIKNPAVKKIAQVFGFAIVGGAFAVVLTATISITEWTGERAFGQMLENIREHFWANILLLAVFCWLLISRQRQNPKL